MKRARRFSFGILLALAVGLPGCAMVSTVNPADLPKTPNLKFVAPSPGLAPKVAAFIGTWEGVWDGVLPSRLVIYQITDATVLGIYAWGDQPQGGFRRGYTRINASFSPDGKIEWKTKKGWLDVTFMFVMSDDLKTIKGTRKEGEGIAIWSQTTMAKVEPTSTFGSAIVGAPKLPHYELSPVPSDVPAKVAAFLGTWEGVWDGTLPSSLLIHSINKFGAAGIYAWANTGRFTGGSTPFFATWTPEGQIVFKTPARGGGAITFTFTMSEDFKTIKGVRSAGGKVVMYKVEK